MLRLHKKRKKKPKYAKKRRLTPSVVIREDIWRRIHKKDQDCFWIFTGERGAGKSTSALYWALKLDIDLKSGKSRFFLPPEMVPKGFKLRKGERLPRVVFRASDFIRLISEYDLPKGSVILWDEISVGISSRDAMSKINKMLVKTMETIRSKNLIVIGTTPVLESFDKGVRRSLNYYGEARGMVTLHGKKHCKNQIYLVNANPRSGKIYTPFLRFNDDYKGFTRRIGHIYIPKIPNRIDRLYKRYKRFFQKDLYSGFKNDLHAIEEYLGEETSDNTLVIERHLKRVYKNPDAFFDYTKKKFHQAMLKYKLGLKTTSQAKELADLLNFKIERGEIVLESGE
ncbi:MAG: ATP-binding protein [bacterium]